MAEIQQKSRGADPGEAHPSGDNRFKMLDASMKRQRFQPDALIEVLHTARSSLDTFKTTSCFTSPTA